VIPNRFIAFWLLAALAVAFLAAPAIADRSRKAARQAQRAKWRNYNNAALAEMEMMEQQMLLEEASMQAQFFQGAAFSGGWNGGVGTAWDWPFWGGGGTVVVTPDGRPTPGSNRPIQPSTPQPFIQIPQPPILQPPLEISQPPIFRPPLSIPQGFGQPPLQIPQAPIFQQPMFIPQPPIFQPPIQIPFTSGFQHFGGMGGFGGGGGGHR
jgi:hypothetical protein